MKKALLTAVACASFGLTAQAELPAGSVAPNFNLADINGNYHNLYSYLDQGYTVILDVSAAWCGPCWDFKQSGVFNTLMNQYGPSGTVQPGKIMVIFVEGESANTIDQLHGVVTNQQVSGFTRGDWVTGAQYPIIDNSSLNNPYDVSGFPSFTVIGRDRIVADSWGGYSQSMLTASWWTTLIDNSTPQYPPSATVDAKAVPYLGSSTFFCNANPTVKFQNYSQSTNITAATIQILEGTNVVATQNWTGNLNPYDVAIVNIPTFTPATPGPFKFKVIVSGDSYTANDESENAFRVLVEANANSFPFVENFEGTISSNLIAEGAPLFFIASAISNTQIPIIGTDGNNTKALVLNFYENNAGSIADLHLANYNTQVISNPNLQFSVAHALYNGNENDKLEVLVSNNCGTTWTTVWSKSGAQLSTHSNVNNSFFVPSNASHWREESVSLTNHKGTSTFIKFRATSGYGNLGYLDNIQLTNTTSLNEVITGGTVELYPNPANNYTKLSFQIEKASPVQVQLFDVMGRSLQTIADQHMDAGNHNLRISTDNLPSGIYNIKIQTPSGSHTERLTVVK